MSLIKNVSMNFIARVLGFFISIPTSIIIARVLGPTDRGVYALVLLIPSLLLLVGDFGIGMANTYFIGRGKFKLADVASNSLLFGFVNGFVIVAIFLLFYKFILYIFFVDVKSLFVYLIVLTVPCSLISNYLGGILLAKFKIKELSMLMVFSSLYTFIGVTFLLLFLNKSIFSLLILSILLSIIVCLIYILLVKRLTPIKISFKPIVLKESLNFGSKAYLANIFGFLVYRFDMLLVNFFVGVTQVGYYSIAVGIAELIWYIPDSIQTILFSEVSSSDRNTKRAEEMTALLCRNVIFITFLLCVVLAIIGRWLIATLYGSEFYSSFVPLLILLPGIIAIALGKITASYLAGIGKPIVAMYSSFVVLFINIILNILLIPKWGIAGAAFATSVAYTIDSIILLYAFLKISKINLSNILVIKSEDFMLYRNIAKKLACAVKLD